MKDLQSLKARVDLQTLVQETHPVTKGSKTQCLWHDDKTPSLHIYPDGYFCFACGASGDHLDWLTATRALSFQEAVDALTQHTGRVAPFISPLGQSPTPSKNHNTVEKPDFDCRLPLKQHQFETHKRRAARLAEVPEALKSRGFTFTDCQRLDIVNENGNAIFPITGPSGLALTLKCRYAVPDPHRYEYITPGRGTPAWCSPSIRSSNIILVIEGELNGMICWLALRGKDNQIGVIGTAGTNGLLHLDVLENKVVHIYADDDKPGHEAKQRWAKQSLSAGAKEVYLLESWSIDACDIAGAFGKAELKKRLAWIKKKRFTRNEAFSAVDLPGATPPALKHSPISSPKPDLVQWCSHSRGVKRFGPEHLMRNRPPTLNAAASIESHHDVA